MVIRENPASRGTETPAEVLVGPPWRMVSVERRSTQQWYGGYPCTLDGGPMGHSARSTVPPPPPHPPLQSASEGIGGARGLGNSVRLSPHPEPRGFPMLWADPGVKPVGDPSDRPVRPRPRARVATGRSGCSHRFTGRLIPCKMCHGWAHQVTCKNTHTKNQVICP